MRSKKLKVSRNNGEDDDLVCPITLEVFRDPVIAGDGHVYEREAITQWIREHATSPLTRQPLRLNDLQPDCIKKRLADQRRNSTVSFRTETNTVTLPPLRAPQIRRTQVVPQEQTTQIVPETNSNTIETETQQRSFFIRVSKYFLGVLCVGGYLVFPIVSFYTMMRDE